MIPAQDKSSSAPRLPNLYRGSHQVLGFIATASLGLQRRPGEPPRQCLGVPVTSQEDLLEAHVGPRAADARVGPGASGFRLPRATQPQAVQPGSQVASGAPGSCPGWWAAVGQALLLRGSRPQGSCLSRDLNFLVFGSGGLRGLFPCPGSSNRKRSSCKDLTAPSGKST
jgi:hypothetical protein